MLLFTPLVLFFTTADWLWQLIRLKRHHQLIPVNKALCAVPVLANLYLRFYIFIDQPVPGTSSLQIKALLKYDATCGAGRVNIERPYVYY